MDIEIAAFSTSENLLTVIEEGIEEGIEDGIQPVEALSYLNHTEQYEYTRNDTVTGTTMVNVERTISYPGRIFRKESVIETEIHTTKCLPMVLGIFVYLVISTASLAMSNILIIQGFDLELTESNVGKLIWINLLYFIGCAFLVSPMTIAITSRPYRDDLRYSFVTVMNIQSEAASAA